MLLGLLVFLPFAAALVVASLPASARNAAAWLAGTAALAVVALAATIAPPVFAGEVLRAGLDWLAVPRVGVGLRIDGLAWLFILLIGGIGTLVVVYARYYLGDDEPVPRFYAFLLVFMGAMLGLVSADNLLLLVVFWELTSLASFLLIGFWKHDAEARDGARMALTITGAGGLCLLAGMLLIGHIVGSYQLDAVLVAGPVLQAHPAFPVALALVLLGAFTKSAQFPFHFWLPHAMAAPTPVSAYLHSATMVKAGVFLLARFYPLLSGNDLWFWTVSLVGATTLLVGAWYAVFQHDIKGLLAYSTISHLGLITLLFGLDSPLAAVAAVFHILNHATFKASLFMAAGVIDHECGTRDMRRINGMWRFMPFTATLAMTAAAAMAGVPLLNGFLSKEMFFAETLAVEGRRVLEIGAPLAATLAGAFGIAYSLRFVHDVFFNGEPVGLSRPPHPPPPWIRLPIVLLVVLCLLVGLFPQALVGPLLATAAAAVLGGPPPVYSLAIWHGLNPALAMSLLAMLGGALFYFALQRLYRLHERLTRPRGKETFDHLLAQALAGAGRVSTLRNGSLQRYLALLMLVILAAGGWAFVGVGLVPVPRPVAMPNLVELAVWTIGVVASVGTVLVHRRRGVALIFVGAVGVVVSVTFEYLSAPDLMLTQLLVEVVSVVLMMLALHHLPPQSPPLLPLAYGRLAARLRLLRDTAIALAAGTGTALLAYAVMTRPPLATDRQSLAEFFLQRALPEGGGSNVVNVILVDFRGFDTLGEITVLAVAALTIHVLLRHLHPTAADIAAAAPGNDRHSLLLQVAARALLPLTMLVAAFLFLRGHNLPGGGFIAGLVCAIGLVTLYIAHGRGWVEARLHADWPTWIGLGLLGAALTGAGAWAFGYPLLTSAFLHPVLPGIGEVPLASAAVFDLGVFAVVVGATLLAIVALARLNPSSRGR